MHYSGCGAGVIYVEIAGLKKRILTRVDTIENIGYPKTVKPKILSSKNHRKIVRKYLIKQ